MTSHELYQKYRLRTYADPPFFADYGKGSYLYDEDGNRYLDFGAGIAVNGLGHLHRKWVRRVSKQLRTLVHASNLYGFRIQGLLAKKIADQAGPGKSFFCNSGAEANEGLIKLARLHGRHKAGGEEGRIYKVVCARNGFHGRTFGGMSATPKANVQDGFRPLLDGFTFAEFNNLDAFRDAVDDQTAAILVESIQGEGGIHPAKPEFLQGLRRLCDERGLLLIIDEVQCGIGRTGSFFAYQHADIQPDAIGMAKGLGSGFPIGAFWVSEPYTDLFQPGSHGSTFGGNPLACAAALATLETMEELDLVDKTRLRGRRFLKRLNRLWGYYPDIVQEVRGRGYMLGIATRVPAAPLVDAIRMEGLLVVPAGPDVIRLLPPLTVKQKELKHCLNILDTVFQKASEDLKKNPSTEAR